MLILPFINEAQILSIDLALNLLMFCPRYAKAPILMIKRSEKPPIKKWVVRLPFFFCLAIIPFLSVSPSISRVNPSPALSLCAGHRIHPTAGWKCASKLCIRYPYNSDSTILKKKLQATASGIFRCIRWQNMLY